MIQEIQKRYLAQFDQQPILVRAPGRINLIGEHTDYNNGLVMPAAIDKALYFAIGKAEGGKSVQVQSVNYDEVIVLGNGVDTAIPSWARYLQAILEILKERGMEVAGINCVFGGDIPIGAGLSSSAALCCGFTFGIANLLGLPISKKEVALISQEAEHRIGLNCGLMDQYAVLFGKKDHVICLDCGNLDFDYFPLQLEQHSLVLIDSKIEHQLEGSPYNDRRYSCERVVKVVAAKYSQVRTLADIKMDNLVAFKKVLDPIDFQRARYVIEENNRVYQMKLALSQGKLKEAGAILFRGHEGLSKEFNVSLPEIDLLVELAKQEQTILGARMMGGGFGGCTINLIENENKEAVLDRIQAQYFKATGIKSACYNVLIGDGLEVENGISK
ncbi:MAG: galactokinase [Saprospiraceae bacterium]|jgi:galactokinase